MSRKCGKDWIGIVLFALAAICRPAFAHPVCLVGRDTTLYRFNADGNGLMEEFSNTSGEMIVGMTRVPPGVAVAGCVAGDVIAVEGGPNSLNRVWRVNHAACGTPELEVIGDISNGVASIAFANGRLFGIASSAEFREFDLTTFDMIPCECNVDLSPTAGTGGVAFAGVDTWYALGQLSAGIDRLFRFVDPATEGGLMEVGDPAIGIGDCGLEYFGGELWGGFRGPGNRVYVGKFNLQTGAFTTIWFRENGNNSHTFGIVMLPERSAISGDLNCDGDVNQLDVAPFVLALTNPSGFDAALPDCSILNADLSGDCIVNGMDVQPFVDALLGS